MPLFGVDISYAQAGFGTDAYIGAGHPFAAVKISEGMPSPGWPGVDQVGQDLYRRFRGRIPALFAYVYLHPRTFRPGAAEANFFLDSIPGGLQPGEGVMLDHETTNGLGPEAQEDYVISMVDAIEARYPGLRGRILYYASPGFLAGVSTDRIAQRCRLWLACYGTNNGQEQPDCIKLDRWPEYTFWQFTSRGRVAGWNGDVDVNRFNGTVEDLKSLVLPGAATQPPLEPPPPPPGGVVVSLHTLAAAHSALALDAQNWGTELGTPVVQFPAHGGNNQRWLMENLGGGNEWRIRNAHNGLVLDVEGFSTENGARVILWEWTGGANQRWRLNLENGLGEFISVHSGKSLDVSLASGSLSQWESHGGLNQRFFGTYHHNSEAAPLRVAGPPPAPLPTTGMSEADARQHIGNMNWRLGVEGFQEAMGLPVDGRVGRDTIGAVERMLRDQLKLSEHFHLDEFRCTHCGRARVHRDLIDLLERIRRRLNAPMGKDSSYRCEEHPLSLQNPSSEHKRGRAWDPAPDFPRSIARDEGALGIGYAAADNARCTHVDMGIGGAGWMGRPAEFLDN